MYKDGGDKVQKACNTLQKKVARENNRDACEIMQFFLLVKNNKVNCYFIWLITKKLNKTQLRLWFQ